MDFIFPQGEFGSDGAKVNYMIDSDSIQYVLCVYSYTVKLCLAGYAYFHL